MTEESRAEEVVIFHHGKDVARLPAGKETVALLPGQFNRLSKDQARAATLATDGNPDGLRARVKRGDFELHRRVFRSAVKKGGD